MDQLTKSKPFTPIGEKQRRWVEVNAPEYLTVTESEDEDFITEIKTKGLVSGVCIA